MVSDHRITDNLCYSISVPDSSGLLSKIDVIISISEITKHRFIEWSHLTQKKCFILPNAITQRHYGVGDRVVFAGFIPAAEQADHYRLADAFVMLGRGEEFGFVFLEALACGIPVVGSKRDGSREALRQGVLGVLVDPDRPDDIQAGILEALKRPRGVIPEGLNYFSFENFTKRCRRILRQVLNPGESSEV